VYPALAVRQALESEDEQVLWVGSLGGMEAELVNRAGIPFQTIPAAGIHGVGVRALPANLLQLARGFLEARKILTAFRPQVLFFTGGYVAVPVALAGRRIPIVMFVPDVEPGLALKLVSRFADRIALTLEASRDYISQPDRVVVTGYPTRPELARWDSARGYVHFRLDPDMPTLLVFGGSKGARSLNSAILLVLTDLLAEVQVVHISGELDWPRVQAAHASLPQPLISRYRVFPYLHEDMGAALAVADLALSRAGASVLGEFPLFGLPAVLVPYPHAWRYQSVNAQSLAERGAAVIVEDAALSDQILPVVQELIRNRPRRQAMQKAMRELARPRAAKEIAGLIQSVAAIVSDQGSDKW
jgi:UDP-N-acetylglucosamine--N-acetylmuramyl-(pentapeptide) pyrophosphoryl-undecaprenol N-acetylglucosamine transferase